MEHGLAGLTVEAFQPRVGERFRIRSRTESAIDAELIEARALGGPAHLWGPPDDGRRSPCCSEPGSPRRYPSASTGSSTTRSVRTDIFLVPLGPDANGMLYEAIFT